MRVRTYVMSVFLYVILGYVCVRMRVCMLCECFMNAGYVVHVCYVRMSCMLSMYVVFVCMYACMQRTCVCNVCNVCYGVCVCMYVCAL